jgi:hypothetical protein
MCAVAVLLLDPPSVVLHDLMVNLERGKVRDDMT